MPSIILAVLAGIFWGIGELCTKSALHTKQVGPITAITVRSTVALPAIWIAFLVARSLLKVPQEQPSVLSAPSATIWKLVLGSGLCAGAVAMICFYSALNLGDISTIKPIAFTIAPATAVVLGRCVLGEDVSPRKWLAVALILAGVLLLTSARKPTSADHPEPSPTPHAPGA